jgi:Putative transposase DNA-binding domain
MAVIVYRYGLPAWVALPAAIDDQMWLSWSLRNDLVSIDLEYEQQVRDIWSSYPAVADAERRIAEAEQRAEELARKVADERRRQRTRAPRHPAVAGLRTARAELRDARQARRDAITAVRDRATGRLNKAREQMRATQKDLYADYCQAGRPVKPGAEPVRLYWATFNAVQNRHRTAARRVRAKRAAGQPARLRHHRWDGSGSITVQLQRTAGDPPRSPDTLASGGGKWRNVLQISQGSRHGTVVLRVGAELVRLPVVVHRDMRRDADITSATLTLRRVAGQRRVTLSLVAKIPDPVPRTAGPVVAVHCGWRREADDAVRVATWRASAPVTVPAHLRDVVRPETATTGIVVMPAEWRDRIAAMDTMRMERDKRLNRQRADLVGWLTQQPLPDGPTAAEVQTWRSPHKFAALAWRLHRDTPPGWAEAAAELMAWRAADRCAWEHQEHGRRKHLGRRDDAWRRFAAWVASIAGCVVVDDTDLAALVRQVTQAETTMPTEVTAVAARQRVDAAPGYLRAAVTAAARREGIPVVTVESAGLSTQCYSCGHDRNDPAGRDVECLRCGRAYDRDESAALHMLRRASGAVSPLSG